MSPGILGKKIGMTQIFRPDGQVVPVTLLKAGPCMVVQRKTPSTDGYDAVQLGLVEFIKPQRINKPTAGRLKKLLDEKRSDEDVMDELFLATLSRFPSEDERRAVRAQLRDRHNRETGFVDVVWALINTREFILNH